MQEQGEFAGEVVAVCVSQGGIPKQAVPQCHVAEDGLVGDLHAHVKHNAMHRAVLLQDVEKLDEFRREGFPVAPGILGENLTVRGLNVQRLEPGTRLSFAGGPLLELTELRKPCFVLDAIHPQIQKAVEARCGFLARVLQPGLVFPGQRIFIEGAPISR